MSGKKVLALDLDPQSDLSCSLGIKNTDELDVTVSTMIARAGRPNDLETYDS